MSGKLSAEETFAARRTATAFEGVSPVFAVSDLGAALAFYCDELGFDLGWKWGDPPTHASVCRGMVSISLTFDPTAAGSGNAYVELTGVDECFAELRARQITVGELADQPYRMRDFLVLDPSGNRLVFGEPA